jgi:transposase
VKALEAPISILSEASLSNRQRCRFRHLRDDWSWRKGRTYGTIIVDLERREVVDLLQDRTATGTAEWLGRHPE